MLLEHPPRWKKCNLDQLLGADYALRIASTSLLFRGEARKQLTELINEIRVEINSRPEECEEYNRSLESKQTIAREQE